MSLEQPPKKETSYADFKDTLVLEIQEHVPELNMSGSAVRQRIFAQIVDFILRGKKEKGEETLSHFFKGYQIEPKVQDEVHFYIDAFLEKNQNTINHILSQENPPKTPTPEEPVNPTPVFKDKAPQPTKLKTPELEVGKPETIENEAGEENADKIQEKRETPLLKKTIEELRGTRTPKVPEVKGSNFLSNKKIEEAPYEPSEEAKEHFTTKEQQTNDRLDTLAHTLFQKATPEQTKMIGENFRLGDTFEDRDFIYTATDRDPNGTIHFTKTYKENGTTSPVKMTMQTIADKLISGKITAHKKASPDAKPHVVFDDTQPIDGYNRQKNRDGSYSYKPLYTQKTMQPEKPTSLKNTPVTPAKEESKDTSPEPKTPEVVTPPTKEKTPTSLRTGEDALRVVHDWKNKIHTIKEEGNFVSFIFADSKNPNNRDTIMIPKENTDEIENIKKALSTKEAIPVEPKSVQEKKEAPSFAVGDSFTTKTAEVYTISKITGTLIHLSSGTKSKVETQGTLSQLLEKKILTQTEKTPTLNIGMKITDEYGNVWEIVKTTKDLTTFSNGSSEHIELTKIVLENLASGAFTETKEMEEVTTVKPLEQKALETPHTVLEGITHFSESISKKLQAPPLNWPTEVLEILTVKEIADINTHNTIYGAVERGLYEGKLKEQKLKKIHQEITEAYADIEKYNKEIETLKNKTYSLPKVKIEKEEEKETPKGEPEKISQPIELSLEDELSKPENEKHPRLGEYVEFEEIEKKETGDTHTPNNTAKEYVDFEALKKIDPKKTQELEDIQNQVNSMSEERRQLLFTFAKGQEGFSSYEASLNEMERDPSISKEKIEERKRNNMIKLYDIIRRHQFIPYINKLTDEEVKKSL